MMWLLLCFVGIPALCFVVMVLVAKREDPKQDLDCEEKIALLIAEKEVPS